MRCNVHNRIAFDVGYLIESKCVRVEDRYDAGSGRCGNESQYKDAEHLNGFCGGGKRISVSATQR